jgi:hypothetical protein
MNIFLFQNVFLLKLRGKKYRLSISGYTLLDIISRDAVFIKTPRPGLMQVSSIPLETKFVVKVKN